MATWDTVDKYDGEQFFTELIEPRVLQLFPKAIIVNDYEDLEGTRGPIKLVVEYFHGKRDQIIYRITITSSKKENRELMINSLVELIEAEETAILKKIPLDSMRVLVRGSSAIEIIFKSEEESKKYHELHSDPVGYDPNKQIPFNEKQTFLCFNCYTMFSSRYQCPDCPSCGHISTNIDPCVQVFCPYCNKTFYRRADPYAAIFCDKCEYCQNCIPREESKYFLPEKATRIDLIPEEKHLHTKEYLESFRATTKCIESIPGIDNYVLKMIYQGDPRWQDRVKDRKYIIIYHFYSKICSLLKYYKISMIIPSNSNAETTGKIIEKWSDLNIFTEGVRILSTGPKGVFDPPYPDKNW